jgi:hypothetical protein
MRIITSLIIIALTHFSFGQCTIDYTPTSTGIYPDTLPTGYVGQSYDTDITFFMPLDTLGYDFTNFKILSVSLPVGLNWECNNSANGCNYNPQQSQYGCVNIAGTPLLAGQYSVDVTVIADLTIVQGYPFTFQIYLEILPSNVTTSNDGFTMVGAAGCSPITVDFTNNNPGLLAYNWNFGNGNISNSENPAPQVYNAPGDYVVNYTAYGNLDTVYVYTLTNVTVNSMSNYGNGFPSFDVADTYIRVRENGNIIYQSSVIGNTNPAVSFTTNVLLNPANTYVLQVYEADETFGDLLFGADDFMGNHTIMLTGCNGCAVTGGDSGSGATVNYTVNLQTILPSPSVISVDTIHVYGYPAVPTVSYDEFSHTLTTPDNGYSYQWYFNDSPIGGATSSTYEVLQSGIYTVVAINSSGCVAFSDTITAVYCSPFLMPTINYGNNTNTLVAAGVPVGYSIQWSMNGVPISGATNDTLSILTSGSYTVTMTDTFACVHTSPIYSASLGFAELTNMEWNIQPNPASDQFTIALNSNLSIDSYAILDASGRVLKEARWEEGQAQVVSARELTAGYYFVQIRYGARNWSKVLIKE